MVAPGHAVIRRCISSLRPARSTCTRATSTLETGSRRVAPFSSTTTSSSHITSAQSSRLRPNPRTYTRTDTREPRIKRGQTGQHRDYAASSSGTGSTESSSATAGDYAPDSAPASPYPPTETAILSAALALVPELGFSRDALARGADQAGYLPATASNLFPKGVFDLVLFHNAVQRLALKDRVVFPSSSSPSSSSSSSSSVGSKNDAVRGRLRSLILARLGANTANPNVAPFLADAVALMAMPSNAPAALKELYLLADELLHLAGDTSLDSEWYTKRAAVAAIYASAELFQSQQQQQAGSGYGSGGGSGSDPAADSAELAAFVDRRLGEAAAAKYRFDSVREWVGYTGMSAVNVLRSWGVRI